MDCLICNKNNSVKFLDNYKLEIKEDTNYFKDLKIYRCDDCDFCFVNPMPSEQKLNHFYENIYRSGGRPPYLVSENYEDQKKHYLEDKNLSYLLYLTTLVDVKKVKNFYDFGGGDGDLGHALKKKFPQLKLFCTEGDSQCKKILDDRGYSNLKDFSKIDQKFDLITTTHSLEHLSDINSIFKKFKEILNSNGYIFFEVPNCPKEYWEGRPYDGPHLLFYTKKSIEKLAQIHNFEIINFSFSAYSFEKDHLYQRDSQNSYYNSLKGLFPSSKIKKILKKFIPNRLISFRQDLARIKVLRNDIKLDWFMNNTGDNCYIRGILRKN
tara:strand:+ start:38 stop:1006 length:969 start_codon:yes stop_codon:yes gene_type:complete